MKTPIVIAISDFGQPRKDADNLVQLEILSPDTKIPFMKVQVLRHELAALLQAKRIGSLDRVHLDGHMVT